MNQRVLHAIGNAHIDPVWLWRWPEGLETIRATFRSALDRMNEFPEFVFTCSSSAFYALLEDVDPGMLDEIAERVREGRWELAGGWWVEPDANVPCGESLLRQGLYGQRYLRERFGVMATVGYKPDTFGHPGTLPQILRQVGLSRYVFMRPGPHEKDLPGPVFIWRSPDGSEVTTVRIAHSYATWPEQIAEHIKRSAEAAPDGLSDYLVFYGVGNHGGGPTRANITSILADPKAAAPFDVRLSRLDCFLESVENEMASGVDLPVVAEELQYHARGCYAAESGIKRHNRRVEHLLLAAERMGSLAQGLVGRCSPAREIQSAWKALLFTQFHDILAGTSLPEAYRDARDAHGYAAHIAGSAMHGAAQSISGRVDTRGQGDAVVVFNTLPWPVRVPVEIERGSAVVCTAEGEPVTAQAVQPTTVSRQRRSCFVADLPALGYRTYREVVTLGETVSGRRLRVEGCAIENDWWRVSVSGATGCIGAIRDLETGIELLRDPGMALVVLDDPSDTWSHGVGGFGAEIGRFAASRVVSDEQGPVRAALRATAAWGSSWVSHVIRLYRDVPIVEGELRIHWAERRRALKLSLPLAITGGVATYEVPYGCAVRASDATEQPGQQWADLTGSSSDAKAARFGVALLNDCKYGYDARPDELRLTILRSPAYAHHDPATLDPDCEYEYTDQGVQTVRYRLMPHIGELAGNEVTRRAMELNVLPIAVNEFEHDGTLPTSASFISADPGNIVVCVCKEAEDTRGLIVRAYESEGTPTRATLHMPGAGLTWQADFAPMQIRSWLINRCEEPWVKEVNALELTI